MKIDMRALWFAALAASGIDKLFSNAIFARNRRISDPFARRHRSHGTPHWVHCNQCRRMVNGRPGRKHRCIAPFVPSPPHGYRWQSGKLVARKARKAAAS